MSRSCHSATFSTRRQRVGADQPRQPADALGQLGLRLCGIELGALLALARRAPAPPGSRSAGARSPRARSSRARRPPAPSIAQNSAWRSRCTICVEAGSTSSAELAADVGFELGLDVREVADRARELADRDRRAAPGGADRRLRPASAYHDRDLEAEAGGLGVNPVRSADRERVLVAQRQSAEGLLQLLLTGDQEIGGISAAGARWRCPTRRSW